MEMFRIVLRILFRILFRTLFRFVNVFIGGNFVLQTCRPNTLMLFTFANPVSQERHLDVAGQKVPRDKFCPSAVTQLPSQWG